MADFPKILGADTNGVLTRTVFIAKIAKVKKVAGQMNELYKKKIWRRSDRRHGPVGGRRPDVGLCARTGGFNGSQSDSEGLQRDQHPRL